jgi:hypothetical protein
MQRQSRGDEHCGSWNAPVFVSDRRIAIEVGSRERSCGHCDCTHLPRIYDFIAAKLPWPNYLGLMQLAFEDVRR